MRNLGLGESLLIWLSYLKAKVRPNSEDEMLEQWIVNRFGGRLYRTFFKTYTEKVWGVSCRSLRSDWAAERIGELSLASVLRSALLRRESAKTLIKAFEYPVLGAGMMWEGLARAVNSLGGQVMLNRKVERLNHDGRRVKGLIVREGRQSVELKAESFVSSIPLADLVERLSPPPPPRVRQAASGLKYRAFALVILIVDGPELFQDHWIYVHEPGASVGRIQNFGNWSAALVPEPQKSCLGMEYFCEVGDNIWSMPDRDLRELAARELAAVGLAKGRRVEDGTVVRQPMAYPVYDRAYSDRVSVIRDFLQTFSNLQSIGRNGMHRYNNQDHAMLTGILAARNLLGEEHDLWEVDPDGSYYEATADAGHRAPAVTQAVKS